MRNHIANAIIIISGIVVDVRAWSTCKATSGTHAQLHLQSRRPSRALLLLAASNSETSSESSSESESKGAATVGLYRQFAEYGWGRLLSSSSTDNNNNFLDLSEPQDFVPSELAHQSVPARGSTMPDATVNIEVKALAPSDDSNNAHMNPIRLARYALLETISSASTSTTKSGEHTQQQNMQDENNGKCVCVSGIQVLNFVIFPNETMDLPVFGADLVTLPGDKHLVAIDFQPLRVSEDTGDGILNLSSADVEAKLKSLHEKYSAVLEWGGDIPEPARRYFSQNAIWSRQSGAEGLVLVETAVLDAFKDYLDVYMDELAAAAAAAARGNGVDDALDGSIKNALVEGNASYLAYRKANDPARPMLKSLYGEEFTERLISEVLFTGK